jgi:hypothetical protein
MPMSAQSRDIILNKVGIREHPLATGKSESARVSSKRSELRADNKESTTRRTPKVMHPTSLIDTDGVCNHNLLACKVTRSRAVPAVPALDLSPPQWQNRLPVSHPHIQILHRPHGLTITCVIGEATHLQLPLRYPNSSYTHRNVGRKPAVLQHEVKMGEGTILYLGRC